MQSAEVTCVVVVDTVVVAKTHLTFSKAHIYKIKTSGNPYSSPGVLNPGPGGPLSCIVLLQP